MTASRAVSRTRRHALSGSGDGPGNEEIGGVIKLASFPYPIETAVSHASDGENVVCDRSVATELITARCLLTAGDTSTTDGEKSRSCVSSTSGSSRGTYLPCPFDERQHRTPKYRPRRDLWDFPRSIGRRLISTTLHIPSRGRICRATIWIEFCLVSRTVRFSSQVDQHIFIIAEQFRQRLPLGWRRRHPGLNFPKSGRRHPTRMGDLFEGAAEMIANRPQHRRARVDAVDNFWRKGREPGHEEIIARGFVAVIGFLVAV